MHHDDDAHLKPVDEAAILAITRPDKKLLTLYFIRCLFANVAFPIAFLPCYLRYITLRYRFDNEGVAVSWGYFFRKETYLTYTRIQDIHVTRGIIERWLGLGTVEIQTAAGSSQAEEAIVGMTEFEAIRNFLYARMRGHDLSTASDQPAGAAAGGDKSLDSLLRDIRDELRGVHEALAKKA
jgi:putative membrane protein